jgi:hypothetical protein
MHCIIADAAGYWITVRKMFLYLKGIFGYTGKTKFNID